jgi:hypothetical protein
MEDLLKTHSPIQIRSVPELHQIQAPELWNHLSQEQIQSVVQTITLVCQQINQRHRLEEQTDDEKRN